MLEAEVYPQPTDGVSRVRFSNDGGQLLVSSWSGSIGIYSEQTKKLRYNIETERPLLDAAFDTDGKIFSASLGGAVQCHTVAEDGSFSTQKIGSHKEAARCLEISRDSGIVVTGGWDELLCGWRPDSTSNGDGSEQSKPVFATKLPGRVFAMSRLGAWRVLVATSNRQVLLYDVRKPQEPELQRDSLLKYQLRSVVGLPDESGFVAASTEGRVAIEKLDGVGSYTFKCHRTNSRIYPVNAVAFHPRWHTFATGGGDGNVSVWDWVAKKRICQYPRYDTSVASLEFHPEGNILAVAVSYTFEEGDKEHPQDRVVLRSVIDADVQPKARKI